MSEADPMQEDSLVGTTSEDSSTDQPKQGLLNQLDLYTVMLMVSLVMIVLATIQFVFVLRYYSESFPFGRPWSVSQYEWLMWF